MKLSSQYYTKNSMKRSLLVFICAVCLFSCNKSAEGKSGIESKINADTINKMVGNDVDSDGCKQSAGYIWSELKHECIRLFEIGTRLNPYENPVKDERSAFVIFEGDRAELFLPSSSTLILERKSEGDPFVNGEYQLIPWKGYVLKKSGTILFTGE